MAVETYNVTLPRTVYSGKNALNNLKTVVAGAKKVAIFTDKGILSTGLVDLPLAQLKEAGVESIVISDLPPEPTYTQVQTLVDEFKASGADFIVAVGGGSAMDAAKLASLLATESYTVKDLLDNPGLAVKTVKTCLIPTTAGTGSEATPNAIVAVPEKIAAATGVDALAHAIECFTSNKANPFSDMFALQAFDLIMNNIETACDDKEAMDAKNNMQIAAFYAGVAIACSGTTAVHALSYPLGGKYHIAHGVSNAMLLVPVMEFNEPVIRQKLAAAYDRAVHGEKTCATTEEKSAWVVKRMGEIVRHLDIPTSLTEFNVPVEDLDGLVEAGMQVTRLLNNNMRVVTAEDARAIYSQILH